MELNEGMDISFQIFPPFSIASHRVETLISSSAYSFFDAKNVVLTTAAATADDLAMRKVRLMPNPDRERLIAIISAQQGASISKILNIQGYRIDDLGFNIQLVAA